MREVADKRNDFFHEKFPENRWGLPRQSADWLAMTCVFEGAPHIEQNDKLKFIMIVFLYIP